MYTRNLVNGVGYDFALGSARAEMQGVESLRPRLGPLASQDCTSCSNIIPQLQFLKKLKNIYIYIYIYPKMYV